VETEVPIGEGEVLSMRRLAMTQEMWKQWDIQIWLAQLGLGWVTEGVKHVGVESGF
jgi:hypothetical protein